MLFLSHLIILTRPAQELLMSLALNCNTHSNEDVEVISNLVRMRLKTKPLANHYINCIKELANQHTENLGTVLKHVIYNELSNARNPNNMVLLSTLFQSNQEKAAKLLAMVFQDLLTNKEDYLRASRALLREVVRALRHDIDFVALCRGFMKERTETQFRDLDAVIKERMLLSLADLITMATFLSITPTVKESFNSTSARGEKRDASVLEEFQKSVSTIQRDAVWWLHIVVPKMFTPSGKDFLSCMNKVLFLDSAESYTGKDNWPPDNDRSLLLSIVSEVPVQEDTLMRTIIIGLSNELPLTPTETLEIADSLVRRVAAIKLPSSWMQGSQSGDTSLSVNRVELLDAVLNLCAYHHPKDIILPSGYAAPKLAIANLYWKAWILLAIVASLNPSSIGQSGWDNFPMLKCLMEILMTNNFAFPPPTAALTSEEKDEILSQELQLAQAEKEEILLFESHLAAATTKVAITESNSLLLSQLISMDPVGPARRPPQSVIDQLKATNKSLKLGQMLCRSRSPDFLLEIIQRQGASQSMPWLAELVQSSEGSLDVLPVQCLCEFLLLEKTGENNKEQDEGPSKEVQDKRVDIQRHVLGRLRSLLFGSEADADSTGEVLEYFMRRLSSVQTAERDSAVKGLELVLSQDSIKVGDHVTVVCEEELEGDAMITTMEELFSPPFPTASTMTKTYKWLLVNLPSLPHFETVRATCCFALRQSCQVEIISERTKAYLMFLAEHCTDNGEEEFLATVIDIAQLIIERPTIMTPVLGEGRTGQETYQALLRLYTIALQQAIDMQEGSFSWQETQDQLFVQWSKDTEYSGKAATLHVLVIHAMIVLLTYGEPQGDVSLYTTLLNAWCPEYGQVKVYLTDTGEEAILLQEWLRLRMIRSQVSRVVDAALSELVPSQLVLFAQSFGIPVSSMSKLLQQLDKATEEDPVGIEEAVLDKGYMVQLVEVQQLRGAKGGDLFCCLLTGETPEKKDNSNLAALDGGITPLPLAALPEIPHAKDEDMSSDESFTNKQIADEVFKIFLSPESESSKEHYSIETRVKKILTKDLINSNRGEIPEDSLAEQIMHKFIAVLDSDDSQRLLDGMLNKTALSCSILRLLRSRQMALTRKGIHCSFFDTISKLSRHSLTDGPLSAAVSQYKKQLGIKEQSQPSGNVLEQIASNAKADYASLVKRFLSACKHRTVKPDSINEEMAVKACLKLKEANSPLYEDFIKAITKTLISSRIKKDSDSNTAVWTPQQSLPLKTCSKILVKLLEESDGTDSSRDHLSNGLLVDWYEIVDPEIVHVHPLLQRQLLFQDRESMPSGDRSLTGHEERSPSKYLLSLLAHQACWETLQDCLDWLLGQNDRGNRLNPTTALDFVWTCFHCPRLWQGRDQKSTAVGSQGTNSAVFEKPVLDLSPAQVSSLTGFILSELSSCVEEWCERKGPRYKRFLEEIKDGNQVMSEEIREEVEQFAAKVLGSRLQLITLCCHGDKKKFQSAVSCALNSSRWSKWFTGQFLVQLYLAQPRVMRHVKNFRSLTTSGVVSQSRYCQLDVLCHRVLSSLAESKPGKEYEDRAYNSSLLLKKLACEHPMLLLRHLPMIAAQLRGRVHLKHKEFINQQHLLVFSHILGVLDLLRPHIFRYDKLIQEGLRDTLQAYFGLIQGECLHHKELAAVVTKLMPFLQHFCAECPDQASTVLQKRVSMFQDLLQEFPALPSLQSVVSAISLSSSPHSDDPLTHVSVTLGPSSEGAPSSTQLKVRSVITPPESISWSSAQLAPFVQRLSPGQPLDDVLKVLGDLDETSKRRVDILDHFVPHLVRLLSDATSTCRTQAHTLLLRHIRQSPGTAVKFVETYMDCLNSTEPDVILTASKFLPEFIVLCNEHSDSLLQKMFSLAVYEAHDVGIPLLKSIQLLNLH
nr:integrator complex subunit 1-like isoform X3 [Pocillopora verrucosa]